MTESAISSVVSFLWRENKALGLCHTCSRDIEKSRHGKTRCRRCADKAAKAEQKRRTAKRAERVEVVGA